MAQYDLLLTQNVAAAGVEFSEKLINMGKGDLLTAIATTKVPTILTAGSDGYMLVRDDNEAMGLKWVVRPAIITDAMVYKGTVGTGGTIEKAALESLQTYSAGWTYRVITAGTYFSVVCEIGDLITCIVSRAGSGDVDGDWTVSQTNLDGAVIGPASVTADHIAQFSGTTGKLIKDGGVLGTMAAQAATDYVTKALYDAYTILMATSDNTPTALTVGEQTFVGRITSGAIAALTAEQAMGILWQTVPATKTTAGTAGWMAKDANYFYICTGANVWARTPIAQNW